MYLNAGHILDHGLGIRCVGDKTCFGFPIQGTMNKTVAGQFVTVLGNGSNERGMVAGDVTDRKNGAFHRERVEKLKQTGCITR